MHENERPNFITHTQKSAKKRRMINQIREIFDAFLLCPIKMKGFAENGLFTDFLIRSTQEGPNEP